MNVRLGKVTMLELVQAVQDHCDSDDEVVAVIAHMLRTGRVVLRGTFASKLSAAHPV
jgi:hypothetical protein